MQFSTLAAFFLTVLAGQALAGPQRNNNNNNNNGDGRNANAGTEGQACTGQVGNLDRQGTCTANGRCEILIPPNERNLVRSDDWK